MGCILVGVDRGSYSFDASERTVTITGIPLILEQFKLIVNAKTEDVIYSPITKGKGGTLSGNVLTLKFDEVGNMDDTDELQIYIQEQSPESQVITASELIKTGEGFVNSVTLAKTGAQGGGTAVTIFDGIDNTGTPIGIIRVSPDITFTLKLNIVFSVGLFIQLLGNGTNNITVISS